MRARIAPINVNTEKAVSEETIFLWRRKELHLPNGTYTSRRALVSWGRLMENWISLGKVIDKGSGDELSLWIHPCEQNAMVVGDRQHFDFSRCLL